MGRVYLCVVHPSNGFDQLLHLCTPPSLQTTQHKYTDDVDGSFHLRDATMQASYVHPHHPGQPARKKGALLLPDTHMLIVDGSRWWWGYFYNIEYRIYIVELSFLCFKCLCMAKSFMMCIDIAHATCNCAQNPDFLWKEKLIKQGVGFFCCIFFVSLLCFL